nr:MAG TPA: hypothetical protein [Caudoviricetes sp.]
MNTPGGMMKQHRLFNLSFLEKEKETAQAIP